MGQNFPYVLPLRERQTVVLAWHPDHIVGPARSTNVKPIFGIAPPRVILSFFMRGGAPESAWGIVGEFRNAPRFELELVGCQMDETINFASNI